MKVSILCLLLALSAGLLNTAGAQDHSLSMSGIVLNEAALPAEGVTVSLLNIDSLVLKSLSSGKSGVFKFSDLRAGRYLLKFSKVGYSVRYDGPYIIKEDKPETYTGSLKLLLLNNNLKEVTIASKKAVVEVHPGKMILNVQSSIIAQGSSVFDILRQSTGVRVNDDNTISLIGRQQALITIDGKTTNLTGDDLVSVLRSMQASTIDRIELITNGSAKYDASSGGIINIVTKKGMASGANVTLTGSAGYGRYYKANGGLVFNDRTSKFNIFGNYNYIANKTFHDYHTDRFIDTNSVLSNYHVDYHSVQQFFTNNFSIGTDYYLSKNHTIGFLINGLVRQEDIGKDDNLLVYNNGVHDSTIVSNSNLKRHISQLNYNLNYSGKLDDKGALITANFNYTAYRRSSAEYIDNTFLNATAQPYKDNLLLQNLSPSDINIWLSKIDFTKPLSKSSKLEAGIKYSYTVSNNQLNLDSLVNGTYTNDPAFNNTFVYRENVNSAYLNYQTKINKLDLTAGLRAEESNTKGTSSDGSAAFQNDYFNLFPNLLLSYPVNEKNNLSLSFSRGIQRPSYEDINPFLYYSDLYDYRAGNPQLKPEYSVSTELSYSHDNAFMVTLYNQILTNAYEFNFYEQNDSSKVNINTRKNYGRIYNTGLRLFVPVTITKWWSAIFDADAAYQRYVTYAIYGNLNKGTQDIVLRTTQSFSISNTLSAEVSGSYESPFFYGISQFKDVYSVNAGIGKQLFNKRGSIKFSATDIFDTLHDRYTVNYQNINLATVDKRESQRFTLTFTYRFGNTGLKANQHRTGAEDEQRRTGTGGN